MIPNVNPSKVYPVAASGQPAAAVAAAGTLTTPWTKVPAGSKWLTALLICGALGGGSEQLDAEQATDGAGTGAKALQTNLATTAVNGAIVQTEVNLDAALDINGGFGYVRLKTTNTGGTGAFLAQALGFGPSFQMG